MALQNSSMDKNKNKNKNGIEKALKAWKMALPSQNGIKWLWATKTGFKSHHWLFLCFEEKKKWTLKYFSRPKNWKKSSFFQSNLFSFRKFFKRTSFSKYLLLCLVFALLSSRIPTYPIIYITQSPDTIHPQYLFFAQETFF